MGKPPKLFDFSLAFRVALTSMREMFAHDLKVKSRVVHLCRGAVRCANIAWQSQKLTNHQARADVDLRFKRGTMSSHVPKVNSVIIIISSVFSEAQASNPPYCLCL